MCKEYLEKYKNQLYLVFRVVIGLLFFQHGAQKLLGWFGGSQVALISQMGLGGVIELVGGLFILFGFFARYAAVVSAVEMLIAYFQVHAPKGWSPIQNGGELALLYFAAFLVIAAQGNGKYWNLEKKWFRKER